MCISQVLTGDFSFCGRWGFSGGLCGRKCPPILNCFGEVGRRRRIGCSEIGDRARHFQHAVIRSCRPAETFSCFPKQRFPGGVEPADGVHFASVQLAIRLALPFKLPVARVCDAPRNGCARFANRRTSPRQLRRRQRGQFDLDVDAIEQRPRQLAQISGGDVWCASAAAVRIAAPAARTRIHCCDQLTRCRKVRLMRRARNGDAARLKRFA